MDKYVEILKKLNVGTYFVRETSAKSVELFFVKKKLDMRRMKDDDSAEITIYKDMEEDGKKFRGFATVNVNSTMSEDEIKEKIASAEYAASFVKNPFFKFAKPVKSEKRIQASDLNDLELSEIADKFVEALYSEDHDAKAFINSFELFVREDEVHMVNSEGTDVSYVKRSVTGEFVAQCKEPQDVETYKGFEYDSLALDDIKDLVKTTLKMTADRATATKMPKAGKYDIVLSGQYLATVFDYYAERAHVGYVYPGYSDFKVGDNVQGDDIKGDKVNLKFAVSVPFDTEGIEMKERDFITDGVLKTLHGGQRFSYYLGVEPVGTYGKVTMPAGKVSMDDMLKKECLYVVNFSDFQMDSLDGHFAGEIRLAYYYDGKGNMECVTGGSINGSIFDTQGDLLFSSEMQKRSYFEGPKACLFKNVAVAGEE
ncbi:MAG: hypothetical protein K5679_10985 [Lachnospiraceae bacterium]|nr:hypothetical protein [Lachnospiraceae bacterium]